MIDVHSYSSSNVTTAAYVTLDLATSNSTSNLLIVDTSTQLMELAVGAVGSEIPICAFQGNGNSLVVPTFLKSGVRLSLKAISGSATSGYCAVSYL